MSRKRRTVDPGKPVGPMKGRAKGSFSAFANFGRAAAELRARGYPHLPGDTPPYVALDMRCEPAFDMSVYVDPATAERYAHEILDAVATARAQAPEGPPAPDPKGAPT
jgi:hypothetical protein